MLEKLMVNPYAWLGLSLLSVFSVIFAIYTWRKGQSRKEFSYSFVSHSIVRDGNKLDPAIKVTFNGTELNNLTSTRFVIWNSGNQVINSSDMVREKGITITAADGVEILSVEIVGRSDETNKFYLSGGLESTQCLSFDYVDKQEGVVLQIFHTGLNDDLSMSCKIKGGKQVRNANKSLGKRKILSKVDLQKTLAKFMGFLAGYLTLYSVMLIASLWIPGLSNSMYAVDAGNATSNMIMTIICAVATLFCDVLSVKMIRKVFQFSVPYALRKFM